VKLEVSQLQVLVQILFCSENSIYQESQTHTVHCLMLAGLWIFAYRSCFL